MILQCAEGPKQLKRNGFKNAAFATIINDLTDANILDEVEEKLLIEGRS